MKTVDLVLSKQLGNRIKELRKKNGFSQEKLAIVSGLHRTYIGCCERGEKNLTMQNLNKMTLALGVSLAEFFDEGSFG